MPTQPLRIFIGTADSQIVAHRVLEYTIRAHASIPVEVTPMLNLPAPTPKDEHNLSPTGFSFTRFMIPELCGYEGRAVYVDADMQVFADVAELAEIPFDGRSVLCSYQREAPPQWADDEKFRPGRHTGVMLLDCARLPWKIEEIVAGLDEGRYTYRELVHDQCLVEPDAIADTIPPEWNSLERYEPGRTRLLHYTVVRTQPWKNDRNPLAPVWTESFAEAVQAGAVPPEEVEAGVAAGYLKPGLLSFLDLAPGRDRPDAAKAERDLALARFENARLHERIAAMEASTSWRVGSGLIGGAQQVVDRARQVRSAVGRRAGPNGKVEPQR